jgi:hypothetical protein
MQLERIRPAVDKKVLIFIAGFLWLCTGIMLMTLAITWLSRISTEEEVLYLSAGCLIAMPVHRFGFMKIVNKNLNRLLPVTDKKCVFSFMTWRSYLIIPVMASMGYALRHSGFPKQYISVIYSAIGLALFLSGISYFRYFIRLLVKEEPERLIK